MKKQYLKPEVLVEKLYINESILASSSVDFTDEEADPNLEVLGKENNESDTWGNVW